MRLEASHWRRKPDSKRHSYDLVVLFGLFSEYSNDLDRQIILILRFRNLVGRLDGRDVLLDQHGETSERKKKTYKWRSLKGLGKMWTIENIEWSAEHYSARDHILQILIYLFFSLKKINCFFSKKLTCFLIHSFLLDVVNLMGPKRRVFRIIEIIVIKVVDCFIVLKNK